MLYTKEFYEIMESFEKDAKYLVKMGSQGLKKEDKKNWERQSYYCDGGVNDAFKMFLFGVSLGKVIETPETIIKVSKDNEYRKLHDNIIDKTIGFLLMFLSTNKRANEIMRDLQSLKYK